MGFAITAGVWVTVLSAWISWTGAKSLGYGLGLGDPPESVEVDGYVSLIMGAIALAAAAATGFIVGRG